MKNIMTVEDGDDASRGMSMQEKIIQSSLDSIKGRNSALIVRLFHAQAVFDEVSKFLFAQVNVSVVCMYLHAHIGPSRRGGGLHHPLEVYMWPSRSGDILNADATIYF